MEHAPQPPGVVREDRERVFPSVALVDDNVQTQVGGEIELTAETRRLACPDRRGVVRVFRQAVVIQPGLADGGHVRTPGQVAEGDVVSISRLVHRGG